MNDKKLAENIIKLVGDKENIIAVTHCLTRLRFTLKNNDLVNHDEMERLEGVLTSQVKGGQVQVVIGSRVNKVYNEVLAVLGNEINQQEEKKEPISLNPLSIINSFFNMISRIMSPILPALIGCGMMLAFTVLLGNYIDKESPVLMLIQTIGHSLFYFFPFFLAVSSARYFKTNEYFALVVAAVMLHPNLLEPAKKVAETGISSFDLFGIAVPYVNYTSTLIPIIFAVYVMSKVYNLVDKITPSVLKTVFNPVLTFAIIIPLTLIVLGPIGYHGGKIVGEMVDKFYIAGGYVSAFIFGLFRPVLVLFGMHLALQPIMIQQLSDVGYTAIGTSAFTQNFAQAGAVFGVFLLLRNKRKKAEAASATISAAIGITEPAIYGFNIFYKKPFIAGCLSSGISAVLIELFGVRQIAFGLPGILSVGALQSENPANIYLVVGASFIIGTVLTLILGIDQNKEENVKNLDNIRKIKDLKVESPLTGELKNLNEVSDKIFSQKIVGDGVAIYPKYGKVYAPFDGKVEMLTDTKHAIGLINEDGVELLIHIGLDTVNLEGKSFKSYVKNGDNFVKGQLLMEFDIEEITNQNYDLISPIIITNSSEFSISKCRDSGSIEHGNELFILERN